MAKKVLAMRCGHASCANRTPLPAGHTTPVTKSTAKQRIISTDKLQQIGSHDQYARQGAISAWTQRSTCELYDASAGNDEEQLMPLQPLAATHMFCLRLPRQLLSFLQHYAAETWQIWTRTISQKMDTHMLTGICRAADILHILLCLSME